MHAYRTHNCAALSKGNVGETVRLSGWVHRKRDHGGVLFVDLRDHYGLTQIVADEDSPALPILDGLRLESVVTIDGEVKARAEGTATASGTPMKSANASSRSATSSPSHRSPRTSPASACRQVAGANVIRCLATAIARA